MTPAVGPHFLEPPHLRYIITDPVADPPGGPPKPKALKRSRLVNSFAFSPPRKKGRGGWLRVWRFHKK